MTQIINMPKLENPEWINIDNSFSEIIGVLLRYTNSNIDFAIDQIKDYPIIINMPCGHVLIIDEREKFPTSNVPCSCENPNHWFVKLEEIENE